MDEHPRGPRDPLHADITQPLINELVHRFYEKIQNHETLGPLFNDVIKDNWPEHLERMCTFWGAVALKTGAYKGKPVPKHMALKRVKPEHFEIWLNLFRETAIEVCGLDIGLHFIERAEKIAESLQLAMFFQNTMAPRDAFQNGVLVERI